MEKHLSAVQIAHSTIRRGAEIFGLGILFRIQEYLIAWGWAPQSDLFRVDILNTIGLSMMLMSLMCWIVLLIHPKSATHSLTMSAFGIATVIALLAQNSLFRCILSPEVGKLFLGDFYLLSNVLESIVLA